MGKTVEQIYQKKSQHEHILARPDMYIGTIEPVTDDIWVYDEADAVMKQRKCTWIPGLYKIFDEILVNASDNKVRDPDGQTKIKVWITEESVRVYNNGEGIPVQRHREHNLWVPEMIFGHLLTSSNYDDDEAKVTGGRNGYGAKLTNVFSKRFEVETVHSRSHKKFSMRWSNNMLQHEEPTITSCDGPDYTMVTFVLVKNPFIKDGFLCPFSLRIYEDADQMRYETLTYRCGQLAPPGTEIYCDVERGVSVYEVNGSRQTTYCRHLFLLGKSFLENKLAGHDVRNYLFYVVCLHHRHYPNYINDPRARYFAGYFTWEKQVVEYNLACIVTLPCFAGGASQPPVRHLGQLMISISYELAYRRGQCGGPEKPLSDLGAAAYQRYWQRQLLRWMAAKVSPPTSTGEDHPHEAPARASLSGEGDASRAANRRRPREVETGAVEVGNEGDEDGMLSGSRRVEGSATDEAPQYTTVAEVAAGVGLEEADVLRTMLSMGLLHRNAEDRSTRLVIPRQYVLRECQRMDQQQKDLHIAAFHPMKLRKPTTASSSGPTRRTG